MTIDLGLLSARRFLPLFVTQFLGAFNDNLLKSGFVVMLAFGSAASGPSRELAGQLAGAALIVPFLFISALAGQLADRFDRSLVARVVKACEVPLIVVAAIAILVWGLRRSTAREPWLMGALGLILAGTVGNLYDRLVFNGVRDFLYFYLIDWPVFNVADCCLVVGAGLLLFQAIFIAPRVPQQAEEKAEAAIPAVPKT